MFSISETSFKPTRFRTTPPLLPNRRRLYRCSARFSSPLWKNSVSKNRLNMEAPCKDASQDIEQGTLAKSTFVGHPELTLNRLQIPDEELRNEKKRVFGQFAAREVILDEEYWAAAWLRAEAQYEALSFMRNIDNYKWKYADEEFYAVKRRCSGRDINSLKCTCVVTVKKEDSNIRRTVLNSVVGTLDMSIRQMAYGENFPGELKKAYHIFVSRQSKQYAYIANVVVSKFARRQGIAFNMLYFAIDLAISAGMKQIYVHVNADNQPARDLYKKIGFEFVEAALPSHLKDQRLLMSMEL